MHRLDDPTERAVLIAGPHRIVEGRTPPILVDEWQRLPTSWDVVRRAVDDDRIAGRFLLTGSAAPVEQPTHSGAGRIVTLRMGPLCLVERALVEPTVSLAELLKGGRPDVAGRSALRLADYAQEVVSSGLPGFRADSPRVRRVNLDGYLSRIVERDFPAQDRTVRDPNGLLRWLTAYAAVPAWAPTRNHLTRLARPPKHHLTDPALAARLLGADVDALLKADPLGPIVPRDGS